MKKLLAIVATAFALVAASQANATYYSLVSCDYKYMPEMGKSVYVGTYKSQYGNLFTKYFDSYCPPSITT